MSNYPLGIRLNNPGLMRRGLFVDYEPEIVEGFASFRSMGDGLYSQAMLLHNYYAVLGRKTLVSIIPRWAPASENDVQQYVTLMAGFMGIAGPKPQFEDVGFGQPWNMVRFMLAMHLVENGHPPTDWPSFPNWVGISQMSVALQRTGIWGTV